MKHIPIEHYLKKENVTYNDIIKVFKISKSKLIRWLNSYKTNYNTNLSNRTVKSYKIIMDNGGSCIRKLLKKSYYINYESGTLPRSIYTKTNAI